MMYGNIIKKKEKKKQKIKRKDDRYIYAYVLIRDVVLCT